MRKTILRALIFSGTVAAVSLAIDFLLAIFYQGGPLAGDRSDFLQMRAIIHGATLVLGLIGAALGFVFLRCYAITTLRVVALGTVLGVFALSGVLVSFQAGGIWGGGAWLLLGSAAVALIGGRMLGVKEAHV
jgi:hypothetical protein